jgi:hypothetical protein
MTLKYNISKIINEYIDKRESGNLNNNFWKWFGDSKITKNGKPLICYHGTDEKNIRIFDFSKVGYSRGNYGHYGYGIYFSTDIRESETYGNTIYECYLKIQNPFTGTDKQILDLKKNGVSGIDDLIVISIDFESFKNSFKRQPKIYRFIDDIEKIGTEKVWEKVRNNNPYIDDIDLLNDISDLIEYTSLNKNIHGVPDYVFDDLKKLNIKPKLNKGFEYSQSLHWITDLGNNSQEVTDVIKNLGYDGVWYGTEIVLFEPNQIKSINNDGSWDAGDGDIYS